MNITNVFLSYYNLILRKHYELKETIRKFIRIAVCLDRSKASSKASSPHSAI